jgi:hypothetical protein
MARSFSPSYEGLTLRDNFGLVRPSLTAVFPTILRANKLAKKDTGISIFTEEADIASRCPITKDCAMSGRWIAPPVPDSQDRPPTQFERVICADVDTRCVQVARSHLSLAPFSDTTSPLTAASLVAFRCVPIGFSRILFIGALTMSVDVYASLNCTKFLCKSGRVKAHKS